jgi:outer membrane protein OmpA-like peptidoglycan-associated protein
MLARSALVGFLVGAAIIVFVTASDAAPPLTLHPGVQVVQSMYDAYDKSGKFLGDYQWVCDITQVSNGGYTYQYRQVGGAAGIRGSQTVSPEDAASGTSVHEYSPNGDNSQKGFVSFLRLSDATYASLAAGQETKLEFDGPQNPVSIRKVGIETLTTLVNDVPTKVATIKARGKAGGTFWVLDNAGLPMVIRAETKTWKAMMTAITDTPSGAAVVRSLEDMGVATTHAILFAFDSADIDPGARPVLDGVAQYLKNNPKVALEIQGHTDNIGGAASNLALSQKRADAVKAQLVADGVDAGRLSAKGYGLSVPVGDNKTPEGRANNRRVVFKTRS